MTYAGFHVAISSGRLDIIDVQICYGTTNITFQILLLIFLSIRGLTRVFCAIILPEGQKCFSFGIIFVSHQKKGGTEYKQTPHASFSYP